MMTRDEEILYAVKHLRKQDLQELSPNDIKQQMGLSKQQWQNGYSKTFTAMQVGSSYANYVGGKYRNIFEKVVRGCYYLSSYGEEIVAKLPEDTEIDCR